MTEAAHQEPVAIIPAPAMEGASSQQSAALAFQPDEEPGTGSIAAFASRGNFHAAQRMAKALSSSSIVPVAYRGDQGFANCLVAMELASRTGASVMMVMQNLYVIEGKPSWSSAFLIASVNSCGRFSALRYEMENENTDEWRCRAYARELATGDRLDGEWITWKMVVAEGWLAKRGSKWQTMPGQMIRYRAAAFWTRAYAPEISLGMHAVEEVTDITDRPERSAGRTPGASTLNQALHTSAAPESGEAAS